MIGYFSPAMPEANLLTSSQAATLLGVHESSVKRWTNDGGLRPIKTRGGHRRISLPDLIAFARSERAEADLLRLAPFEEEAAVAALAARERNDFGPFTDLLIKLIDTRPPVFVVRALRYLDGACGVPLARSFDSGICSALRRVGGEWADGTLTIAHEHRFTQKVLDALYALRGTEADEPRPGAPLALVGVAETCFHEIGAMLARLALEAAGWQVTYLGSNVPFGEFAGLQAETGARLIAVSFVPPTGNADALRCLDLLKRTYKETKPYYVALGGGGLIPDSLDLKRLPFLGAAAHRQIESLQDWARSRLRAAR